MQQNHKLSLSCLLEFQTDAMNLHPLHPYDNKSTKFSAKRPVMEMDETEPR